MIAVLLGRIISHTCPGRMPIICAIGSNLEISGNCESSIILNLDFIVTTSVGDNTR